MINRITSESNNQIRRKTVMDAMKSREALFNEVYSNAFDLGVKNNDFTPIRDAIESSSAWKNDEERKILTEQAFDQFNIGIAKKEAVGAAETYGMGRAQNVINNNTAISKDQALKLQGDAQQASNQAVNAARTEAADAYTKAAEAGGSIRRKYDAAAGQNIANPDVREARINVARQKQTVDLSERFSRETNTTNLAQLKASAERYKEGGSYDADYYGQEELQKEHYLRILQRIEAIEADTNKAPSRSSQRIDAENYMANYYMQFNKKEIPGTEFLKNISALRELAPEKAAEYEAQALGGGTNPAAQASYEKLDAIIEANKPGNRATPQQKEEYQINAHNARQAIFQAYFDGVRGEDLAKLVEGYRTEIASRVLPDMFSQGTIGTEGFRVPILDNSQDADKAATAFAFHSTRDNLDLRYGHRTLDAARPGERSPLAIGGAKAEQVLVEAADHNMRWANKELETTNLRLTDWNEVKDADGDRQGAVTYNGSDGGTYRVNADAENGKRFLEKLVNGKWETYKPEKKTATPGSGSRYRPLSRSGDI
ncbi:MAG: hypothetical protein LBS57_05655 [Treponema sp.]|nr:hypothetical protein [Treponema sp.]